MTSSPSTATTDTGNFGWAVLGFFIPVVGLVLWLVWKPTRPRDARMSRNGFIAGFITSLIFSVIYAAIVGSVIASAGAIG